MVLKLSIEAREGGNCQLNMRLMAAESKVSGNPRERERVCQKKQLATRAVKSMKGGGTDER